MRSAHDRYEEDPSAENLRGYADAYDTYGVRVVQLASTVNGEKTVRGWSQEAARSGDAKAHARYESALAGGVALRAANREYRRAVQKGPAAQVRAASARALVMVEHGFRGDARTWQLPSGRVESAVGAVVVERDQKWKDAAGQEWNVPAGVYEVSVSEGVTGQEGLVRGVGSKAGPQGQPETFEVPVPNVGRVRDGGPVMDGLFVQHRGARVVGSGEHRRFEGPEPVQWQADDGSAGRAA